LFNSTKQNPPSETDNRQIYQEILRPSQQPDKEFNCNHRRVGKSVRIRQHFVTFCKVPFL